MRRQIRTRLHGKMLLLEQPNQVILLAKNRRKGWQVLEYVHLVSMLKFLAWHFIEEEKPNFDLVTLAPPMVYGPLRHSIRADNLNESTARIYKLFINSSRDAELPPSKLFSSRIMT